VIEEKGQPLLEIQIEEGDAHTLFRPLGELDAYTVGSLREALARLAGTSRLLIDLSKVPFMDSAALNALVRGIGRIREADGVVAVACSRPALTRLLQVTGFDDFVPITESVEEAEYVLAGEGE